MKKVLIIACSFPPFGGVGVQRTVKFVKYLPLFDWEPIVLTVQHPIADLRDRTFFNDLPLDLKVIRTKRFDVRDIFLNKSEDGFMKKMFFKAFKFIILPIEGFLVIPDFCVGWNPFALITALRIIYRYNVDAVYISGDPFSSFLLGPILKLLTGKPYILDFRDEWVEFWHKTDAYVKKYSSLRIFIEKLMEAFVVLFADAVISVTESIVLNFRKRYCFLPSSRFYCITNGFDYADFSYITKKNQTQKLTLTYTGSLYKVTNPEPFLKALSALIVEWPEIKEKILVNFVGKITNQTMLLIKDYQNKCINVTGFVSHLESIRYLFKSDILLSFFDNLPIFKRYHSAKIFEYIAAKKPILAIGPGGEIKYLIESYQLGFYLPPNDIKGIKNTILNFFEDYKQNGKLNFSPKKDVFEKFDRKILTGRFADILMKVSNG